MDAIVPRGTDPPELESELRSRIAELEEETRGLNARLLGSRPSEKFLSTWAEEEARRDLSTAKDELADVKDELAKTKDKLTQATEDLENHRKGFEWSAVQTHIRNLWLLNGLLGLLTGFFAVGTIVLGSYFYGTLQQNNVWVEWKKSLPQECQSYDNNQTVEQPADGQTPVEMP